MSEKIEPAKIENLFVLGKAPYVATISDGSKIKNRIGVKGWRYHNKRLTLTTIMPDGGLVEEFYPIDMDIAFTSTNESFEGQIGRGARRFWGWRIVIARNTEGALS